MDKQMIVVSVFALGVLTLPASAADEYATDWAASPKSQARLVAGNDRLAGFEIRLAPGAITYWRDPGDAGTPPTFEFAGSDNVASVEPVFPAPERIAEFDGSIAFGYEKGVVLPLRIKPRDPARPVTLALHATYAVCEKICLPAQARLRLMLPVAPSPYAASVEAAVAAAPHFVPPGAFGDLSPNGPDGWILCSPRRAGDARNLFVETPEGWRVAVGPMARDPTRDCFALNLLEKPQDGDFPVTFRLTMTGHGEPTETTMGAERPR